VLLVICAKPAVVRASPTNRSVVAGRHFWSLDEHLAATPVVIDIVRHEHLFMAMHWAMLQQEDTPVLKDDFPL
jgi:hypothetical protein